jgi:hypothetical protein
MIQTSTFRDMDDIERQVQAVLSRRRAHNCSGQNGEDITLIRVAIAQAKRLAVRAAP